MVDISRDKIKRNLKMCYNEEAGLRNIREKDDWKKELRERFCDLAKKENKETLLEIGAGCGYDSKYFSERGLSTVATDISSEMVKLCKEKSIEAYELDFYNLAELNRSFDCCWSMCSLLHVPKADLPGVLTGIDKVLNKDGLFFMGVYGGENSETERVSDVSAAPRFFSAYTEAELKAVLEKVFEITEFKQFDAARGIDFQAVFMRKKGS